MQGNPWPTVAPIDYNQAMAVQQPHPRMSGGGGGVIIGPKPPMKDWEAALAGLGRGLGDVGQMVSKERLLDKELQARSAEVDKQIKTQKLKMLGDQWQSAVAEGTKIAQAGGDASGLWKIATASQKELAKELGLKYQDGSTVDQDGNHMNMAFALGRSLGLDRMNMMPAVTRQVAPGMNRRQPQRLLPAGPGTPPVPGAVTPQGSGGGVPVSGGASAVPVRNAGTPWEGMRSEEDQRLGEAYSKALFNHQLNLKEKDYQKAIDSEKELRKQKFELEQRFAEARVKDSERVMKTTEEYKDVFVKGVLASGQGMTFEDRSVEALDNFYRELGGTANIPAEKGKEREAVEKRGQQFIAEMIAKGVDPSEVYTAISAVAYDRGGKGSEISKAKRRIETRLQKIHEDFPAIKRYNNTVLPSQTLAGQEDYLAAWQAENLGFIGGEYSDDQIDRDTAVRAGKDIIAFGPDGDAYKRENNGWNHIKDGDQERAKALLLEAQKRREARQDMVPNPSSAAVMR